WYAGRGRSGGVGPCTYVLPTGGRRGERCGLPHTAQRCFVRLTNTWRAQFPDVVELPRWGDLLRPNVAIFDLDFDAILAAMYDVTDSAEGDCYLSVPPNPGIEAAALGASAFAAPGTGESAAPGAGESALSGTAPTEALHTFALDSGASRSFYRDSTTLTPSVGLSQSPWLTPQGAQSLRTLPRGADLQDAWVDQFTLGGQRVTHCTCSRTGCHLATFTRRPGSSLYTLTTTSPPVTVSVQVAASGQVFSAASRSSPASAPCSCRPLSHETLLWHHRLGHPSMPRLRDPVEPVEVAVDSGAARAAEPAGARTGRAESGGPPGVPSWREPFSPQQLHEWYARRCRGAVGAAGASGGAARAAGGAAGVGATGGASGAAGGAAGAGAAGGAAGGTGAVGAAGGAGAAGPGGAHTGGTGAARAGGAVGVGAAGAGAVATGGAAGAAGGAAGVGATGGASGAAGGAAGAGAAGGAAGGTGAVGAARGAHTGGTGAVGAGVVGGTGADGAAGVVAGDPGAEGTDAVSA
ncbi:unnamed protein product, partial [Closterium sp. NIES-53]